METNGVSELLREVIKNGISIEWITYVYIAIVSFVTSLIGVFFASYFKKQGEESSLKANFNDVIERLKKTTKLTEDIKSSIGIATIEHQIKFSKYYEKRFEVIQELYEKLIEMEEKGKVFIRKTKPTKELNGVDFNMAQDAISDFVHYSKINKIWVDEKTFDEIERIALKIDQAVHGAAFNSDVNPINQAEFEKAAELRNKFITDITKDIPAAKDLLVESLRKILDPNGH